MVVLDMLLPDNSLYDRTTRGLETQMLQAWERVCILVLAAALGLAPGILAAQDEESGAAARAPSVTDSPPAPPSPEELERTRSVDRALAAGERALLDGRIDQPPSDCAWFHFRTALELDPANEAAISGLRTVQGRMIDRAVALAKDLDFESAERALDDAALVWGDPQPVDAAEERIRAVRLAHADELEYEFVEALDGGDFDRAERLLIDLIALGDMDATVSDLPLATVHDLSVDELLEVGHRPVVAEEHDQCVLG